jgi:4-amino-4-deoxy-L-arabinose transferase-like glycosyltransferase
LAASTPVTEPASADRPVGRIVGALGAPTTTVVLVVVAAAAAALIQQLVYPAFSWNRDEPVYLWQVELLRAGQLTAPDLGFPELLHPWLSAWRDGQFFTQYPLGWPVVIFAGSLLGWPGGAVALAAALATSGVCLLAFELLRDRVVANVAGIVFVASPIFAVQSGVYLTYLFTLGLGLWFAWLFLAAVRMRSPRHAVAAGVCFGWIVCTRTFDAVLWGGAAVAYVGLLEWGGWKRHLRLAGWFLAAMAPFVVLQLLHNRALTGSPLTFPISVKDPLDSFGFGFRRLMPTFEAEAYGLRRAATSTAKHAFFLPWFLFGAYLGVVVAGAAAWLRRRHRPVWFLMGLLAVFPLGYFPFWGNYISSLTVRLSGPIYYVPLYAPLAILISLGVVGLIRRHARLGVALVVALTVITVPMTAGRLGLNRELSRGQVAWRESVADIDEPSVVVVAATAYLLYLNPYSTNAPEVDGEIIYATNAWPSVFRLLDQYPDRQHLLQRATLSTEELLPSENPSRAEVVLDPIERVAGDAVEVTLVVTPPRAGEAVWVHLDVAGVLHWRLVSPTSQAGVPIRSTWLLTTPDSTEAQRGRTDAIVLAQGELTVNVGAAFGTATRRTRLTPYVGQRFHARTVDGVELLTPGTSYRGRGPEDRRFPDRWDEVLETPELTVELRPEWSVEP